MMNLQKEPANSDFESIYLACFSKMKYFAKVYVLSEEDAENIVQDVFADLWEKKTSFTASVNPAAYLFTAVRNRCLNYLRHQSIQKEASNRMQEEHRLTMQASFHSLEAFDPEIFSENDTQEIIHHALHSLSKRCRQIFIMSKIEGKKHKEIAAELNISVNTIETQMGFAYKKLRKKLRKLEI
jgi:RNA polymerase sigma-70 factor (ECF subfamily)